MEALGLFFIATFAFGTFWFWLCFLAFFIFGIMSAAGEFDYRYDDGSSGFWTSVWFVLLVGLMWLASGVSPVEFYKTHTWYELLGMVIGWFAVGFSWSLFKWRLLIKNWFEKRKGKLLESDGDVEDVKIKRNYPKPKLKDHLDNVGYWIVFFPFSFLAYFISEWLVDAWEKFKKGIMKLQVIYDKIEGKYGE